MLVARGVHVSCQTAAVSAVVGTDCRLTVAVVCCLFVAVCSAYSAAGHCAYTAGQHGTSKWQRVDSWKDRQIVLGTDRQLERQTNSARL